ncbi:MAG: hypothetical protein LBU32_16680 [Clostridiales bacterium]|jgi:hypothetical protein|nr:hypothetical protein [Clostridiales bacterium]
MERLQSPLTGKNGINNEIEEFKLERTSFEILDSKGCGGNKKLSGAFGLTRLIFAVAADIEEWMGATGMLRADAALLADV